MSALFIDHLKIFLSKIRLYLDANSYIDKESSEYNGVIADLEAIQNNLPFEEKNSTYKRLNLYISIIPTIVAALLTAWVFFFTLRNSARNHKIQEVSNLRDSVINLSSQLVNTQKTLFRIDSLSKIDSTINKISTRFPKDNDLYYGRNRAVEVLLDKYLENIKVSQDLEQKIDTLKATIVQKQNAQ